MGAAGKEMTAERKKKTIEELKKKLPEALSKLAGKSISAVAFGKLTIAETPSVLFKADKARLGRKYHGGSLFVHPNIFENPYRVLTSPPPPLPLSGGCYSKLSPP